MQASGLDLRQDRARLAAQLEEAAALVEDVRRQLDVTKTRCDCCEANRYANFVEYKAWQALEASVSSIRRAAGDIDNQF